MSTTARTAAGAEKPPAEERPKRNVKPGRTVVGAGNPPVEEIENGNYWTAIYQTPVEGEEALGYYFKIVRPDEDEIGTGHGAFSASQYVRMLAVIADEIKSDMAADNKMSNKERSATLRSLDHPLTNGTVDGLLEGAEEIMERIRKGVSRSRIEKDAAEWLSRY